MKHRALLIVTLVVLVVLALSVASVFADGSRGIYASCPYGAYAGIAGSGYVKVTFYYSNSNSSRAYSVWYNLGAGSSRVVYSYAAGSYNSVVLSGNGYVSSAGCRR